MSIIKALRLKNGTDLISFVDERSNYIILVNPLEFYIDFDTKSMSQSLMLNFWIPRSLIVEKSINLKKSEILFFLTPEEEFKEFYLNFLNTYEATEHKQQIDSMLEYYDAKAFNKVH